MAVVTVMKPKAVEEDETHPEPQPANVIEALARVMRDLPGIGKNDQASQQQGGYAYRGIEAITGAAQKLLGRYGVVFVPRVLERKTVDLTVNGKPWTEEQLTVEYRVFGPGGTEDFIVVGPLIALGRDNSDKGTNKCLTQAFKYALLQVLCIGDGKADGDGHDTPQADAPPDPEQWFKDNGWESRTAHDEWRTSRIAALKAEAADNPEGVPAIKAWQEEHGLDWKHAIARPLAEDFDAFMLASITLPANPEFHDDNSPEDCPGCGEPPHNCKCPDRPF